MPAISTTEWILVVLSALVLLLLVWSALLSLGLRRQSKARQKVVDAVSQQKDILDVIGTLLQDVEQLYAKSEQTESKVIQLEAVLDMTIKHVGVIRYDAFPEVGGHLSFSVALLDAGGDGIVLTAINGRNESRVYAKPVSGRQSEYNLSNEEEKAIVQAHKEVTA